MNNKVFARLFAQALALVLWSGTAGAAEIEGSVLLDGPPPAPETITVKAKSKEHSVEGCGSLEKVSPKLQVSAEGGVKDAVVWLDAPADAEKVPEGSPEGSDPVMDQKECVFSPHVLAIPAGGEVAIRNSDGVIHNVRIFREGVPSMLMHRWQKADAANIVWRFEEPGRYVVRCGVHPWMYGWVFVAPGRAAAVTDPSGRFILAGVPPGRHTLHVWHEALGTLELPVEVGTGENRLDPIRVPHKEENS